MVAAATAPYGSYAGEAERAEPATAGSTAGRAHPRPAAGAVPAAPALCDQLKALNLTPSAAAAPSKPLPSPRAAAAPAPLAASPRTPPPPAPVPGQLPSLDLEGVAALIRSGAARRIVVMAGAGISVSAGIPDFRTPGTGLYSQLQRYRLPYPEAVFSIDYFRRDPKPFYTLAKELFPGDYAPTPAHFFLRLLSDRGLLLRAFTQNIDGLEQLAGVPAERFFGEPLPARFHRRRAEDLGRADLLVVMGTSLVVQPFASMVADVSPGVPRLLVNRERVGHSPAAKALERAARAAASSECSSSSASSDDDGGAEAARGEGPGGAGSGSDSDSDGSDASGSGSDSDDSGSSGGGISGGFDFGVPGNSRDAVHLGDADAAAWRLAELLGWTEDLRAAIDADAAARAAAAAEDDE
ncbi:NAD-dependent deacetylase sirtuin [Raphidocelis subcapitata]|uniref:NAD-dependent deacetylase sirtuin n=1 Tax=Raphidocelis subcapitata TaxID=307507 RepID=A0A2V0P8M4_9CHLO|nr:NAD-dependent deacetylase sirtuin [Raphidocelis subcapitata]|eukprot:GBF96214.1 NAD-dependent deacetylase sirtuin [Raphidocelis subcapitata]